MPSKSQPSRSSDLNQEEAVTANQFLRLVDGFSDRDSDETNSVASHDDVTSMNETANTPPSSTIWNPAAVDPDNVARDARGHDGIEDEAQGHQPGWYSGYRVETRYRLEIVNTSYGNFAPANGFPAAGYFSASTTSSFIGVHSTVHSSTVHYGLPIYSPAPALAHSQAPLPGASHVTLPRDRLRNGASCPACRALHIRCDGGRPCGSCVKAGRECGVPYVKVKDRKGDRDGDKGPDSKSNYYTLRDNGCY